MSLGETAFLELNRKERANMEPVRYYKRAIEDRITDFEEAILGYDAEMAMQEASRCLECPEPQPCMTSCPAGNDLATAMWHISQGEFVEAALIFNRTSPLIEVCGRVCPNLCQESCAQSSRRGPISIGKLEEGVGGKLFARSTRSVALTPEGEAFYPVARRLLADWERALEDVRNLFALQRGQLDIAAMAGGGDYGVYANGRFQMAQTLLELNSWLKSRKKIPELKPQPHHPSARIQKFRKEGWGP